jgi:hypothetical protein
MCCPWFKAAFAPGSQGAAGGDHWLLMTVRGISGHATMGLPAQEVWGLDRAAGQTCGREVVSGLLHLLRLSLSRRIPRARFRAQIWFLTAARLASGNPCVARDCLTMPPGGSFQF